MMLDTAKGQQSFKVIAVVKRLKKMEMYRDEFF